jgi:SUN family beta-glucosidase
MKFTKIAFFGTIAIVNAQPHRHAHAHFHADKRVPSPIEKRADATAWVTGPTVTVFDLDGTDIPWDEVEAGLLAGYYVLVSDSATPTSTSIAPTSTPTSSSSALAAQFYETQSTTSVAPTSSTPPPAPPTVAAAPATSPPAPAAASSTPSGGTGGTGGTGGAGLGSSFPSDSIPCSTFPSAYGPISADWLGMNGWIGLQQVPNYSPGAGAISYISTSPVGSNEGCTPNSFCSYMCPPGYQKSQWPAAQGSTGQSIGGLYCNAQGMLELSRPSVPQLCTAGTGEVSVQSTIGKSVAICRTDYPGSESETVAMTVSPGQTDELTCPDANNYYMWNGQFTSAQYYVNPSGVPASTACQWQNADTPGNWWGAPGNIGNWAPLNLGVGKGPTGETFISMFQNAPTNPSGTLDFNIKITGSVSGDCKYENGIFYNNGVVSPTGCTVSFGTTRYQYLTDNYRSPCLAMQSSFCTKLESLRPLLACFFNAGA